MDFDLNGPLSILVLSGAITAFLEAVKMAINLPSRVMPLLSILLGIAVGAIFPDLIDGGALGGLLGGLTASGLYSGGKATIVEPYKEYQVTRNLREHVLDDSDE
jgi:hypothetical protein